MLMIGFWSFGMALLENISIKSVVAVASLWVALMISIKLVINAAAGG